MISWIDYGKYLIEVKPVKDQSGIKNVIQHTYYLKEDINGCYKKKKCNKRPSI